MGWNKQTFSLKLSFSGYFIIAIGKENKDTPPKDALAPGTPQSPDLRMDPQEAQEQGLLFIEFVHGDSQP